MSQTNRSLFRQIIRMAVPAMLDFSLQTVVKYVDLMMVGKLGVNATAAVGLTSEVSFLLSAGIFAVGVGVLAYISAEIGAGTARTTGRAAVQALILALIVGAATTLIALGIGPFLPGWMGAEPEIRRDASRYFLIVSLPYVFFSVNSILGSALKATGDMKTPLAVNAVMNLCNIVLNYLLIYETHPVRIYGRTVTIPGAGWGVRGAAAATAFSLVVGGSLMLAAARRNPLLRPGPQDRRLDRGILRDYVTVGIPAMLHRVINCGGRVLFTAMVAQLGTVLYASHSLAMSAESAFYIPCVGLTGAVSVLAGNARGEGNLRKLDQVTMLSCLFAALIMSLMSLVMFLLARQVIGLMTGDQAVLEVAPRLLRIVAVNEPFMAVSFVLESIFQGAGDTRSPFLLSTATMWLIRVVGTGIFLLILGGGVEAAWYCMIAENTVRCVLLVIRYLCHRTKLVRPGPMEEI